MTAETECVDRRASWSGIPEGGMRAEIDRLVAAGTPLTEDQRQLAEADCDGRPQIIRGVAGSGKTWVLANHLARRVARHSPELPGLAREGRPRIGVVCFNRSLVPFIERRIEEARGQLLHRGGVSCSVTVTH